MSAVAGMTGMARTANVRAIDPENAHVPAYVVAWQWLFHSVPLDAPVHAIAYPEDYALELHVLVGVYDACMAACCSTNERCDLLYRLVHRHPPLLAHKEVCSWVMQHTRAIESWYYLRHRMPQRQIYEIEAQMDALIAQHSK